MIKRVLSIAVLFVMIFGSVAVNSAPAAAAPLQAPLEQVKDAPNADLLPADTAVYFDFRSADLQSTIDFVRTTYEKVMGEKLPPIFTQINVGLTDFTGRDTTFEKDVQTWLGDHVTLGVQITDAQVKLLQQSMESNNNKLDDKLLTPGIVGIIAVKDDAAASSFISEGFKNAEKKGTSKNVKTRTAQVNGADATFYEQTGCTTNCVSLVVAKGFIAIGTTDGVNNTVKNINAKGDTLGADKNFIKLMSQLKEENLLSMYISPRVYNYVLAAAMVTNRRTSALMSSLATPDATESAATAEPTVDPAKQLELMTSALKAIEGQAFGIHYDKSALVLDVVQSVNQDELAKAYQTLGLPADLALRLKGNKIEGKLIDKIPAKAIAAVGAHGLGDLYDTLKEGLKSAGNMNAGMTGMNSKQAQQLESAPQMIEGALKMLFDMDIKQDLFSWANGDFAAYLVYNPKSDLAKVGTNGWPFDQAFIVDVSDTAKAKTFIEKLNAGIEKQGKVKPESVGADLYQAKLQNGISIVYGLVGNTFIVTNASGLAVVTSAAKGDGVLSSSPVWKAAQANIVTPSTQVWYFNFDEVITAVKDQMPKAQLSTPQTQKGLNFLNLFQSATLSSGVMGDDGISRATFSINMK